MAKSDEQEFNEAVNMSARDLEGWSETDESREVGQKDGGGDSKGHESGRRIVEILDKSQPDCTSATTRTAWSASSPTSTATKHGGPRTTPRTTPTGATRR